MNPATLQGLALLDIALMAGIADWLGATQPVHIIVLVLVGMTAVAGVLVAISNRKEVRDGADL